MYNMYDTCGKHLLPKAKLYDNETTCTIFHVQPPSLISELDPLLSTRSCDGRLVMYSDDTQPGRTALIDPRTCSYCADSIPGPC